jgi:hypothetical protein
MADPVAGGPGAHPPARIRGPGQLAQQAAPAPATESRAPIGPNGSPARPIFVDPAHLDDVRIQALAGETAASRVVAELERSAAKAVVLAPPSVVDKQGVSVAPSGDIHDYLSLAPYWWPDPARADGRPYVLRDGQRNPEARIVGDREQLAQLISSVSTLGLAHHVLGGPGYAEHIARLVRRWFLDPATAMNPHLRYAQCIPGVTDGRSLGLIETALFPELLDGVLLAADTGDVDADDLRDLRAWMRTYLRWLVESPFGRREARSGMNHETWYAGQIAGIALFVDDLVLARRVLERARDVMIGQQIEPDGRQPRELARPLAWHYSSYNLTGFFNLATLGDRVGVDLWDHATRDGRSLRGAIDFLASHACGDDHWALSDLNGFRPEAIHRLLRRAAVAWDEPRYRELAHVLGGSNPRVELLVR